jgi:predicted Ser/Thr protein kinase
MGAESSTGKRKQEVSGVLRRPDGLIKPGSHLGENVVWADKHGKPLSEDVMKQLGAKRLQGGIHAETVLLVPLGGGKQVVEKRYGTDADGRERFEMEARILTRLKNCDFVPKLLHADKKNAIIRMSYCGTRPQQSHQLRKQCDKLLRTLEVRYGLYRKSNIGKKRYQLGTMGNLTVDHTGKLYLIDFASDHWHIKEPGAIQILKRPPRRIGPHEQ